MLTRSYEKENIRFTNLVLDDLESTGTCLPRYCTVIEQLRS